MNAIGKKCKKCGHTLSIKELFSLIPTYYYHCRCTHPANKNIFTKILWILKGRPALEKTK